MCRYGDNLVYFSYNVDDFLDLSVPNEDTLICKTQHVTTNTQ